MILEMYRFTYRRKFFHILESLVVMLNKAIELCSF